jgi:hypothetical protein
MANHFLPVFCYLFVSLTGLQRFAMVTRERHRWVHDGTLELAMGRGFCDLADG